MGWFIRTPLGRTVLGGAGVILFAAVYWLWTWLGSLG